MTDILRRVTVGFVTMGEPRTMTLLIVRPTGPDEIELMVRKPYPDASDVEVLGVARLDQDVRVGGFAKEASRA